MPSSLTKVKNYEIHSITTCFQEQTNANIASWVMQCAMQGKYFVVALYHPDYTLELVKQSKILNINLLAEDQYRLVNLLGRKSGRQVQKLTKIAHQLDNRGCPFLLESIGYFQCEVSHSTSGGDHELVVCKVIKQVKLNPDKQVLTMNYLREKKLVRG